MRGSRRVPENRRFWYTGRWHARAALMESPTATTFAADAQMLDQRFVLDELVASRPTGTEYRARHALFGSPVTAFVVDLGTQASDVAAFHATARRAQQLRLHAHLARVFEAGQDGDRGFIIEEPVPGPTLSAWMSGAALTDRVRVARQLVDGFRFTHDSGVVHGGLTTDLVTLTDTAPAFAMIRGFGLAPPTATLRDDVTALQHLIARLVPEHAPAVVAPEDPAVALVQLDELLRDLRLEPSPVVAAPPPSSARMVAPDAAADESLALAAVESPQPAAVAAPEPAPARIPPPIPLPLPASEPPPQLRRHVIVPLLVLLLLAGAIAWMLAQTGTPPAVAPAPTSSTAPAAPETTLAPPTTLPPVVAPTEPPATEPPATEPTPPAETATPPSSDPLAEPTTVPSTTLPTDGSGFVNVLPPDGGVLVVQSGRAIQFVARVLDESAAVEHVWLVNGVAVGQERGPVFTFLASEEQAGQAVDVQTIARYDGRELQHQWRLQVEAAHVVVRGRTPAAARVQLPVGGAQTFSVDAAISPLAGPVSFVWARNGRIVARGPRGSWTLRGATKADRRVSVVVWDADNVRHGSYVWTLAVMPEEEMEEGSPTASDEPVAPPVEPSAPPRAEPTPPESPAAERTAPPAPERGEPPGERREPLAAESSARGARIVAASPGVGGVTAVQQGEMLRYGIDLAQAPERAVQWWLDGVKLTRGRVCRFRADWPVGSFHHLQVEVNNPRGERAASAYWTLRVIPPS